MIQQRSFIIKEGGETLEQVAQRGGECPITGTIQCQVGQGSEQHDLIEDAAAYCTWLNQMRSLPTQTFL